MKIESAAVRAACAQLGINGEHFVRVCQECEKDLARHARAVDAREKANKAAVKES